MKIGGNKRLLVVDDDEGVVDYLVEALGERGYRARGTTSAREAVELVERKPFDMVITDVKMPEMHGMELLRRIHELRPNQLVLLITAFGSIETAVQALRLGACDFVTKPFRIEALVLAVERSLRERRMNREIVRLRASLPERERPGSPVARSAGMRRALDLARRAAASDATVLLTGESGVGKGVVARFIHEQSPRAAGELVELNCAALPASLIESELFGVRRGAFTDAREDRDGLFRRAHGGTLLLDEIGEMPLEMQPKLLQVIESGRVRPVGGGANEPADARLIAATNQPLEEAVREQRFRADLFYRLNVVRIEVPALRERTDDILPLADVFLERACRKTDRPILGLSAEALRWIAGHRWPGNVRELANVIERAVVLCEHDTIMLEDLAPPTVEGGHPGILERAVSERWTLDAVERAYIGEVLEACGGNKSKAARVLDIDRRTLYRRLEDEPEPADDP